MPQERKRKPPKEIEEYLKSPPQDRHRFSNLRRGMKVKFEVKDRSGEVWEEYEVQA